MALSVAADGSPDSGAPASGTEIDIDVRDPAWHDAVDDPEGHCHRAAFKVLEHIAGAPTDAELAIVLADDAFVANLNARYRGQDKPTNVLSFPGELDGVAVTPVMIGDIAIARETVLREADEQGKTPADHLSHMVVHGALHLLGYDHEDDDEALVMETAERQILGALGVADPYDDGGS